MVRRYRSRLTVIGPRSLALGGQTVFYTLKRSHVARYVRLEIRPGSGFSVVVPERCDIRRIPDMIRKKEPWVLKKLRESAQPEPPPDSGVRPPFYLGRPIEVVLRADGTRRTVTLSDGRLTVSLGPGVEFAGALEAWYRGRAEALLVPRATGLATRLGVRCGRLRISSARTRWGSCSVKGSINLNWKLVMAPEWVIDYVVIHELTHLTQMDHSRRFWAIVQERCPGWRECRAWLHEHQAVLAATF